MFRLVAAGGVFAVALVMAGGAQAQSRPADRGAAAMRLTVVAAGAAVTIEDNSGDPRLTAPAADGLKSTIRFTGIAETTWDQL